MKASKIIIEILLNEKLEFITYKNITVWDCLKKIKKDFGEVIIYDVKTEY